MEPLLNRVVKLFGVSPRDETDAALVKHQQGWNERRRRLLNRRCGGLIGETAEQDGPRKAYVSIRHDLPTTCNIDLEARDIEASNRTLPQASRGSPVEEDTFIATKAPNVTSSAPTFNFDEKKVDEENVLGSTYDLTDFYARESITKLVNEVLMRDESKRAFGMGLVGNLLSRKFRKDLTYAQVNALYSFNDHRPFFTYWVTTVQVIIMIITLLTYGFGPPGFTRTLVKGTVYVSSSAEHREAYYEQDNFWIGPRSSDLIHLGAKFTPCMRKDALIYSEIAQDRETEKLTGCCIRKDDSGCLQTTKEACSSLSVWHSWNESTTHPVYKSDYKRRLSGPVCGQDPNYCSRPSSNYPHEWPDDITQWPICHERLPHTKPLHHMSCEVVAKPCCIGIYGQCRLTTSQHCQFLRGTFHPEASLCSQVSCMEDVCGMIPFYAKDYPDQFYRLFTALFLHAGIIQIVFTVVLQYYIMRDIERLLGPTRMALLYILPGIAGYMASATFVPYHTQVGPSGSQFALLACLMAETINSWKYLESPMDSLLKLISIAFFLLIVGLLPWIDNYAHIFGFITGFFLSLALTPYLTPFSDNYTRRIKVIQTWICLGIVGVLFVLLPLPLYVFPLYKCPWCQYLDCLPLTENWCENQDIKVARLDVF